MAGNYPRLKKQALSDFKKAYFYQLSRSHQEKEERQTYFVARKTDAKKIETVTALRLEEAPVPAMIL